ncbi:CPBP family intramembrane glutamic endopeptidase [Nocardioides piscis]|uniref:CPBP family intramembrane metalloprotease n=1 Tax=Nocardioides piscis TaxID=2714938 RepID=A0A6G7YDJ7_9ACTN|nr:type II CAAX endopeptidase family protein [Nocardioides piscis]QIK74799.1 CPBP family intramembrane metalloprotease [Nocardioides piscis]
MHRPLLRTLRHSLVDKSPRNHRDTDADLRRRQLVCVAVVLIGAATLGWSLRIEPGSLWFYPATFALAAVWAIGAFASGNLHLGHIGVEVARRPVWPPVLVGLVLSAVFLGGSLVVREIPWLAERVRDVLDYADQGSLSLLIVITAVNGIAEELFFRGALYAAIPRHPVVWTTIAYGLATAATGNPMLAFAAVFIGVVVGLERRASGGVLAPILTHVTWSLSMLLALPLVLG